MSDSSNLTTIRNLIEGCWPGEWGIDPVADISNCVVYRATDIDNDGNLDVDGGVERFVFPAKIKMKSLKLNDIILEASGGAPDKPVGRVALVKSTMKKIALTSNFFRYIRPKSIVNAEFLSYQLVALNRSSEIWRYQQQTTGLINLKVNDYLEHQIWVPDIYKQLKIARILGSIGNIIKKTEDLIAKYQEIKAGMMHDLFTRGVLADGKIRPSREQSPNLYQETLAGWIPKEWHYEFLDKLATRGSGHTPNKDHAEYWNGGIKWISLADSNKLDQLYISDTNFEISSKGIQNSSAVLYPAGIVVLSRDAGIGKSAITTEPMAVSQHFMCWKCDQKMDSHFLYYWLQYNKRHFENIAMGSTILTIGLPYFKKLKMACPIDVVEQKNIAKKLLAIDRYLFGLQSSLEKNKKQKLGLMQDLLTGKVSVNVGTQIEESIDG